MKDTNGIVTRYVLTYINRDGMRQLHGPNQGHLFSHTPEAAQKRLDALIQNNSEAVLAQTYGPQSIGTFEVRPVECYESGDAKGIYFSDPNAPFDKEHAEYLKESE